tara:strand:- start:1204 stop:2526 length:1323 start_codon:yes stop_codon:yes gene_type:complete
MNLSIIIPVYNGEKFIKKCLDSICNQIKDKKNIELIIVDDYSKDKSVKILEKYKKLFKFIKLIKLNKNSGTASSRDLGIKIASGKFLFFVDIDDSLVKKSIAIILDNLKNFPNKDLFVLRNYITGIEKNKNFIDYNQIITKGESSPGNSLINLIDNYNYFRPTAWNFIFRSKFLKMNSIYFNKSMRTYEDCPFVAKAICASNNYKIIEKPVYIYQRYNPNSLSVTTGFICVMSNLKIIYELFSFIKKEKQNLNKKKIKFLLAIIEKRYSYAFSDILVCTESEIKIISQYLKKINFIIPDLSRLGFKKLNNLSKNNEKTIFLKLKKFNIKKLNIIKKKFLLFYKNKLILFCVGRNGSLISTILKNIGFNVSMFVDNNRNLSFLKVGKVKIYSPKYLINNFAKLTNHSIIICDSRIDVIKSIKKQLQIIGFKNKNILPFDML